MQFGTQPLRPNHSTLILEVLFSIRTNSELIPPMQGLPYKGRSTLILGQFFRPLEELSGIGQSIDLVSMTT